MTIAFCHPEPSLAKSEANRQTQSKDPMFVESTTIAVGNFRIVVRFLDEQGIEFFHDPSREAAAYESPARKCRVKEDLQSESRRDGTGEKR